MKRVSPYRLILLMFLPPLSLFLYPLHAMADSQEKKFSGYEGEKWAICIGLSGYGDPKIIGLPTSRNDAKGLAKVLREHGGFNHVLVLTDDMDKKDPFFPDKKNILGVLQRYGKEIKPQDFVLFSFSGQGITHPSGRSFLLAFNTSLNNLQETGIPVDLIFDFIKGTGVNRSLVFIDACREEIIRPKEHVVNGIYPDRYIQLEDRVKAIFFAAQKGFYSHDDERSGYSVFTKSLINGLEGEADSLYGGNGDGVVTLRELSAYVQEEVLRGPLEKNRRQKPYIKMLDRHMEQFMVSSVRKIESSEGTATKTVEDKITEVVKREAPAKEEIKIGAPAPKITELMEGKKESETAPKTKSIDEKKEIVEKREVQLNKEVPAPLKEVRKEPAPKVISEETESSKLASISPKPLYLREKVRDLNSGDIRSMLFRYNFYSTCWSYNSDFCNPDGDFKNHLLDNHGGTVTDQATGLMWQKGGSSNPITWVEANEYMNRANKEDFAGFSDWRIPTMEELASLMENAWKNGDLFIDPLFDRVQRHCWSGDTNGMSKAWKANFHLGFCIDFPMISQSHVRLVRSLRQ
ncbi:MAG: DUF1566 domain-containing protein [Pseudomonadota bacterium]